MYIIIITLKPYKQYPEQKEALGQVYSSLEEARDTLKLHEGYRVFASGYEIMKLTSLKE